MKLTVTSSLYMQFITYSLHSIAIFLLLCIFYLILFVLIQFKSVTTSLSVFLMHLSQSINTKRLNKALYYLYLKTRNQVPSMVNFKSQVKCLLWYPQLSLCGRYYTNCNYYLSDIYESYKLFSSTESWFYEKNNTVDY